LGAVIDTPRLQLREWEDEDIPAFSLINQDPHVLEFLPGPLTPKETEDFVARIRNHFQTHGFGLWTVCLKETQEFIGYVGLNVPGFEAHFTPCVEIGWRFGSQHWGKGYATEAAQHVLSWGFEFGLKEIVSFTVPANTRSIRVMEKIGMTRNPKDNFLHPKIPAHHRLAVHVLYRCSGNENLAPQ